MKKIVKNLFRLTQILQFVWQSSSGWTIARIALLVEQSIMPLLWVYLQKLVIDAVAIGIAASDKEVAFKQIILIIIIGLGLTIIDTVSNSVAGLASEAQNQALIDYLQNILHAKAIEVDLEYYENSQYYDILHRTQQEAPFRPAQILNNLLQVCQNGISLLLLSGLLFSLHWSVPLILFGVTIPSIVVRYRYSQKFYHWQRQRTPTERQASYFSEILTNDQHAKEIRLFNVGHLFTRRFSTLRQQLRREKIAIFTGRTMAEILTQTSSSILVFSFYGFLAYQAVQSKLTLGDLVMYDQAFQRGQAFFRGVLSNLSGLYENNLFLSHLYEFLDLKPKIVEALDPNPVPRFTQTGIVFNHVSFQYPMSTRKALEDITLTIHPGEVVALVGENGSGKTTLIKLLCRLFDPTDGSITIDGIDLRYFEIADLRSQISVIFQDYVKYHLTAMENIWLGNIDLSPTDEKIVVAARCSGADEVITKLPQKYNTVLGKLFDQGEELSIGQWQKIALARAFLRDSQVIILDEPTSAIDSKAEEEIFQRLRQLIKGKAAILISHRLSTVKMADRIYVLSDGRISESGTHDELIQRAATYANLFKTQFKH
jgi:ATP-binding cassette subfamily B protein